MYTWYLKWCLLSLFSFLIYENLQAQDSKKSPLAGNEDCPCAMYVPYRYSNRAHGYQLINQFCFQPQPDSISYGSSHNVLDSGLYLARIVAIPSVKPKFSPILIALDVTNVNVISSTIMIGGDTFGGVGFLIKSTTTVKIVAITRGAQKACYEVFLYKKNTL